MSTTMTEKDKNIILREILDRLQKVEGVKHDTDLAVPLKVTKLNITSYKARGSIPWGKLYEYSRRKNISLDYLVNGRGNPGVSEIRVSDSAGIYTIETNQDAVYDISAQVYSELENQRKEAAPEKFKQLVKLLHRQTLETGNPPSADKIKELVLLI